jgi:hypothetical protein
MSEIPGTTAGSPAVTIESLFLRSASTAPRLRLGLLVPRGKLPAPAAQIVENLRDCDFVEIVASITVELRARVQAPVGPVLYRLYRWWDRLAHTAAALSLAPCDCAVMLSTVAPHIVESDPTGSRLVLSAAQHAALKSCRLDVILVLGSVPDPAELANAAKFGVWSNKIGDPLLGDQEPRHFWHTMRRSAPLSISLEALIADRPASITLSSGALPLVSGISTLSNLLGPARMAEGLMLSKLWQLHSSGWNYVLSHCSEATAHSPSSRPMPTNWQMLTWILPKVVRQMRHRIKLRHTTELWRVGIRLGSPLAGLQAARALADLSWLEAPTGHYYADPFAISHLGRFYLLVEDFDIAANKGWIVCLQLDQNGTPGPAQIALERPYHLSYPQVFAHDGEKFMIPESGYNNTVEIYRAISFPTRWELARVLFRGPAFDTTVLHHAGLFWFFVTLIDSRYPQRIELVLFYANSLFGDWTLHPASPISRDIRVARCAGAPFLDRGTWIRPAQDGSETYGGALRFQRIVQIDPQQYLEEPAGSVSAHMIPGATGVHTYNRDGNLEVIDAKSRVDLRSHVG